VSTSIVTTPGKPRRYPYFGIRSRLWDALQDYCVHDLNLLVVRWTAAEALASGGMASRWWARRDRDGTEMRMGSWYILADRQLWFVRTAAAE
jgi:hypothetical protein